MRQPKCRHQKRTAKKNSFPIPCEALPALFSGRQKSRSGYLEKPWWYSEIALYLTFALLYMPCGASFPLGGCPWFTALKLIGCDPWFSEFLTTSPTLLACWPSLIARLRAFIVALIWFATFGSV